MSNVISARDGRFVIYFDYSPGLIAAVKLLPGRRFDKENRCWTVPANAVDAVAEFAGRLHFEHTRECKELAAKSRELSVVSSAKDANLEVTGLGGELMPFQRAGVAYALATKRCFIADEMGLGKTIEALATLEAAAAYPALVVCPMTLKLNWQREARAWLPARTVAIADGKNLPEADVLILNYDLLKKHQEALEARKFVAVIFDESHYAKNHKAQRTKAAAAISRNATYRLALTGTPVLNRPIELLSQLSILDRLDDMGGFWPFVKRYCAATKSRFGWDMSGSSHLDELNERLRGSCYIRRLKKDVLKELPAKTRTVIPVQLDNWMEYAAAEADLVQYLKSVAEISDEAIQRKMRAEQLTKIEVTKQIAARGKMKGFLEWVSSFLESGEKLVVFAHHHSVVDEIAAEFNAPQITGKTSAKKRQAIVDQFQTDKSCRLLVCNIKAGGLGITLTAASNVAFIELGWTPAVHDQAEDRCHRKGQHDPVNAWYFIGEGTVDEAVFDLVLAKRSVVDGATEGTDGAPAPIFDELIRRLVDEGELKPKPRAKRRTKRTGVQAKPVEKKRRSPKPASDLARATDWLERAERVEKAIVFMYRLQTSGEQSGRTTRDQNAVGFNMIDASFGSSLAEQVLKGRSLSPKQIAAAEKILRKYKRQLGDLAIPSPGA